MSEFQPGDRVRDLRWVGTEHENAEVGTVKSIGDRYLNVRWPTMPATEQVLPNQVEKVTED